MNPIDRLIADRPEFHAWPDGTSVSWAIAAAPLLFLHDSLAPGMITLETGAGQSTVAFAIAGTTHVSITPDHAQADRIRAYCAKHNIGTPITFVHESSDTALPAIRDSKTKLDMVLIDGAHSFPFPILDWYYTQSRLRVGGMVVVDDYPMPSVRVLYDLLRGEDEWELVREFQRTAFFRRVRETGDQSDWAQQRINTSLPRTNPAAVPRTQSRAKRIVKRLFYGS